MACKCPGSTETEWLINFAWGGWRKSHQGADILSWITRDEKRGSQRKKLCLLSMVSIRVMRGAVTSKLGNGQWSDVLEIYYLFTSSPKLCFWLASDSPPRGDPAAPPPSTLQLPSSPRSCASDEQKEEKHGQSYVGILRALREAAHTHTFASTQARGHTQLQKRVENVISVCAQEEGTGVLSNRHNTFNCAL